MMLLRKLSSPQREIFGKYETQDLLGVGTCAQVYQARVKKTNHYVALKALHLSKIRDMDVVNHFKRQVKVLSRLNHPNIVQIRDHGSTASHLYVVMDIAESTLEKQLRGAAMPINTVLTVATQVTQALRYIHAQQIVHRDIKPSNILKGSHAYALADFGFAKVLDSKSVVTVRSSFVANIHYVSPEVILAGDVGPQSDIYSLGMVMYHMTTGQLPFQFPSAAAIIDAHLTSDLPDVRAARPELPESVANVIAHATAKNKNDRYATADEMMLDLSRIKWEMATPVHSDCLGCGCRMNVSMVYCPRCGRRSF